VDTDVLQVFLDQLAAHVPKRVGCASS
jgi:hypothetical protein